MCISERQMDLLLWLNTTPLVHSSFEEFSSQYESEAKRIRSCNVVPQHVFKFKDEMNSKTEDSFDDDDDDRNDNNDKVKGDIKAAEKYGLLISIIN